MRSASAPAPAAHSTTIRCRAGLPGEARVDSTIESIIGAAIAPALQTRLMDVAADAQTLAAALNHSALNIANASGAWVGGLVIAAGFGYTAPAAAGAAMAVAGLAILTISVLLQRKEVDR